MSYLGLVPSENTTGEKRRQGSITKPGSRHARRLLVQAAWHYRRAPRKGRELRRRQEGRPQAVCAISWKAQQRLHRSWVRLDHEPGKQPDPLRGRRGEGAHRLLLGGHDPRLRPPSTAWSRRRPE
jgi:hypothetical protein